MVRAGLPEHQLVEVAARAGDAYGGDGADGGGGVAGDQRAGRATELAQRAAEHPTAVRSPAGAALHEQHRHHALVRKQPVSSHAAGDAFANGG